MAKNANCAISDSVLCKWIDKDCNNCHIRDIKHDEDVRKALTDFEVTMSLLPEDIDELQGDECQFCKGEKGKRAGFALFDLGHSEPKSEAGIFFGLGKKVRRRVGSLIPLSISVCSDCRRAFRFSEIIKWIGAVAFLAISIAIITIPAVSASVQQEISLAIVAAATLIGYLAGRMLSKAYVKVKSGKMHFHIFDIPVCARMRDLGWFIVQDDTPVTRFLFTKKSHTRKMDDLRAEKEAEEAPV
jgi:hypothetical protein